MTTFLARLVLIAWAVRRAIKRVVWNLWGYPKQELKYRGGYFLAGVMNKARELRREQLKAEYPEYYADGEITPARFPELKRG